jgi:hypothetical protein
MSNYVNMKLLSTTHAPLHSHLRATTDVLDFHFILTKYNELCVPFNSTIATSHKKTQPPAPIANLQWSFSSVS